MKLPTIGDKIYIKSSYHISRGEDDVDGGLATIDWIKLNETLPDDHYNKIMVSVKEVPDNVKIWIDITYIGHSESKSQPLSMRDDRINLT